jgi:hypothetical protein
MVWRHFSPTAAALTSSITLLISQHDIFLWARIVAKILAVVRTKIWAHRFSHNTESYVRMYVANTNGAKWREISPLDFLIGLNHGVRPCSPIVQCQVILMHNI